MTRIAALLLAMLATPALAQAPPPPTPQAPDDLGRAHDLCLKHSRNTTPFQPNKWFDGYEGCAAVHEKWLESERGKQEAARMKRQADDDAFLKEYMGRPK